jgi:hypothetical protein
MPFEVERLPEEPIILATLSGDVDADDLRLVFVRSAELMADIEGSVYRITDVREVSVSFPDLLKIVAEGAKHATGTSTDPRVKVCLVGTHVMGKLYIDMLRKQSSGAVSIPMRRSMETALESVRIQIENERRDSTETAD